MKFDEMKRFSVFVAVMLAVAGFCFSRSWTPDSLAGYERTTVCHPDGTVCTVVRKLVPGGSERSFLYVHGYNDYFFQAEEGDRFVEQGYNFYAVDLHGYGRSIQPGERPYQTKSVSDYYQDIDSALAIVSECGSSQGVGLMGHSTGGLITASYMTFSPSPLVDVLVLNSPFLDWNMGGFKRRVLVPLISCIGSHFPGIEISEGESTAYGESCSADFHGEWHYNYAWKTLHPRKVTGRWIHMIQSAQTGLRDNPERILVPILLMHSARSVYGNDWNPDFQQGDAVLNVDDINRIGRTLGPDLTVFTVRGGMHDLFLSAPAVRNALYADVFSWLKAHWPLAR